MIRRALALACLCLLLSTGRVSAQAGILPFAFPQFFDSNGNPLAGGTLTFYFAGTNTLQFISSASVITGGSLLPNPLTLDSAGRTTTQVFLSASSYKIVLKDSDGITIRTADNVSDTGLQAFYAMQPLVSTITTTGTVNDLTFTNPNSSAAPIIIRCNNASTLFITGIVSTPNDGQRLTVVSVGTGDVFLSNQSLSSAAGNRLINIQTAELTPLMHGTGVADYVYDATTLRWRMISTNQGNWGTFTPAWTVGCPVPTCTLPAIGNGTLTGRYMVVGRICYIDLVLTAGSTTTFGTGTNNYWLFSLPLAAADMTGQVGGSATILDNGTRFWHLVPTLFNVNNILLNLIDASSTQASGTIPMTWTTNDKASISLWYFLN